MPLRQYSCPGRASQESLWLPHPASPSQSSRRATVLAFGIQVITVDCSQSSGTSLLPTERTVSWEWSVTFEGWREYAQSPGKGVFSFLPAFAATICQYTISWFFSSPSSCFSSYFLVISSPCSTSNCLSPSLALFPPFLLFVIIIVIWYHYLLFHGLERIVLLTLGHNFTMHLVWSTCKCHWKGVVPLHALWSCIFPLLPLCQI